MPRLPVTVIGGYLGAGKTTLVNHLLRHAGGRRLAVLVNDFGDLSIDADLIQGSTEDVMQLAGGCVCCTIGSDLMATLTEIRERFPDIDHVLLEASGVALPGTVAASVGLIPSVRRAGVVVVVAADRLRSLLADRYLADTIERQIAAADLLIVGHSETLDPAAIESVRARLRGANGNAPLLFANQGQVPIDLVLEPRLPDDGDTRTADAAEPPTDRAVGGVLAPRPISLPVTSFESVTLAQRGALDIDTVCDALADPTLGIERAKGILRAADKSLWLVHGLGARTSAERFESAQAEGRLVVIGLGQRLDTKALCKRLPGLEPLSRQTL